MENNKNQQNILNTTDITKICRICLQSKNELFPIFNVTFLAKMISECSNYPIEPFDQFPQHICSKCIENVNVAYNFRLQCNNSYKLITELLKRKTTKTLTIKEENDTDSSEENYIPLAKLRINKDNFTDNSEEKSCKKLEILLKETSTHIDKISQLSTGIKPYICNDCDKCFYLVHNLRKHIHQIHPEKSTYICSYCIIGFITNELLEEHIKNIHKNSEFICNNCKICYPSNEHLNKHILYCGLKKKPKNKLEKQICNICNKKFKNIIYLKRHIKNLHNGPKQWKCYFCHEIFQNDTERQVHLKIHENDKPLCSECGKRFSTKSALTRHLQIHSGEKPHHCQFCNKSFSTISKLKYHIRYHTNEKTHFCETCKKGFFCASKLKIHIRTHTKEFPFKCEICLKSFNLNSDLRIHMRRRHTGEQLKCNLCDQGFYQGCHLTKHKRIVHGVNVIVPNGRVEKINEIKS